MNDLDKKCLGIVIGVIALYMALLLPVLKAYADRKETEPQPYMTVEQEILLEEALNKQPQIVIEPIIIYGEHAINEDLFSADELTYMAKCVQAEAGNQDLLGKRLVVDVILNRLESEKYPNTIKGVINAPGQFTVVSSGTINKAIPDEDTIKAIEMELNQKVHDDIYGFNTSSGKFKYGDHWFW